VSINFSKNAWVILNPIEQEIKRKIEAVGTPLKDWDINIYRGIVTGCNEAFIIDKATKNALIKQDPQSADIIRPILRGKDIKRYGYEFAEKWLLFVPWHFPLHRDNTITGVSEKAEQEFLKQYPAVYKHLLQYKTELSNRNKAETGIRYEWYALQRWGANYWEDFYKQKIIYPCIMASEPCFVYDEDQHFTPAPGNIITGNNIKYLLAFLCSKACYFALRKYYMGGGIEGELKTNRLLILPVPKPTSDIEQQIEKLLNAKKYDEIDIIVYRLYGLNTSEIEFIETQ